MKILLSSDNCYYYIMTTSIAIIKNYLDDNNINKTTIQDYDIKELSKHLLELINSNNTYNNNCDHKLYPIVDTLKGRPLINDLICKHYGCDKTFKYDFDLIEHLKSHNKYSVGYSKSHEETNYNFDASKYYCGSTNCSFSCSNETDIIMHYKLLGIYPFFKIGDSITLNEYVSFYNKYNNKNINEKNIEDIINNFTKEKENECCVCMMNEPNITLSPCYHTVMCFECFKRLVSKKCPVCRTPFTKLFKI